MGGFDFEFIIPLRRDDLLSAQSADQYYVSEVYYGRDLETKLKGTSRLRENFQRFIFISSNSTTSCPFFP